METDEEDSSEVPSINDLYSGFEVFERKNVRKK